ncbi:Phosphoglycolate phosphatase [Apilactobacillus kunkeei]|uniref:HAD family hydrolase n=1 Tax=Apilactobacillus kunkeei TaxID=148814 RepID=UPI0006CEA645|nr:HAD-IA family hydrolase [Apilactobacillus kunkeei]KPN83345.1 Phosphoglycolate phosphatase [Apilactobacillus kunkeei]
MNNFIFDFDGTLANSGKTGELATKSAFHEFELQEPSSEEISYYMGIPIEVSFKKMAPGRNFSDDEFEKLLSIFRKHYKELEASNLVLFNGIFDCLKELHKRKHKLFVVSSKHSTALLRNLNSLKIDQFFDGVIGSDQVEHFKPAPDGVLKILNKFRLSPDNSIMIGDAIFDLQMGKSAGVNTAGVSWGAHDLEALKQEHPDYILNSPKELLDI